MFKKLMQNKKAQQTAEYAILIALVVGAVIAMQTYAQRTIQARIRGASMYLATGRSESQVLGSELQYEPYYIDSTYSVTRDESTNEIQDGSTKVAKDQDSLRGRSSGGYQKVDWNGSGNW